MRLQIQPGDAAPIYRQIVWQVTDQIASGRLQPGARLDSQRDLARELVISPLTVKKAYDELERAGLIETRRGRGTFVRQTPAPIDRTLRMERLRQGVRRLLTQAALGGISDREVRRILTEEQSLRQTEHKQKNGPARPGGEAL